MDICVELYHIVNIFHCPWDIQRAIAINSIASPIRFVSTVNIPLDSAYLFW